MPFASPGRDDSSKVQSGATSDGVQSGSVSPRSKKSEDYDAEHEPRDIEMVFFDWKECYISKMKIEK